MRGLLYLLVIAGALFIIYPQAVEAHIRMLPNVWLAPRSTSDSLKTAPCGDIPRTSTPNILSPGQAITVNWEETINHPGYFRIAFSPAADLGFDQNVLLDNIPHSDTLPLPRPYQTQVTLPDMTCIDCTLQLTQVMTDSNPPRNYYSCADIVLVSPGPTPPTKAASDLNSDGRINTFDFGSLVKNFGVNGCNLPGDLNQDCRVDAADIMLLILAI